jgi:hypothetical protein
MIDPKNFIKPSPKQNKTFKDIEGSFSCPEIGCFEVSSTGKYDSENKKVYWVCPNGHEGSARLVYE